MHYVSRMRNLSCKDTVSLIKRVRALIKDGSLHFEAEKFNKEALVLACLAFNGGGWMPYEGDCTKSIEDCELLYQKQICDELFCDPKKSSSPAATHSSFCDYSAFAQTTMGFSDNVTIHSENQIIQRGKTELYTITLRILILILFLVIVVLLILTLYLFWRNSRYNRGKFLPVGCIEITLFKV